jgi:hypothetical protein
MFMKLMWIPLGVLKEAQIKAITHSLALALKRDFRKKNMELKVFLM